jgi:hypothetical protein
LLGISSHPPGEFSLTSAGTKNPGQVKRLHTKTEFFELHWTEAFKKALLRSLGNSLVSLKSDTSHDPSPERCW